MTQEDILQLRFNVLTNVTMIPKIIMERNNNVSDYDSDIAHLNDLEAVIEQLETIFNMGEETASFVIGYEFLPEEAEAKNAIEVPLFLYLDVIINILEPVMNDTAKLDERKQQLLARLKKCREKATKLPHHPNFQPKKHLSEKAINQIMKAKGSYVFDIINIDGKNYLSISSENNQIEIAFQEDYNVIKIREIENHIGYIQKIQKHIKKYFKNNEIPESANEFNNKLVSQQIKDSIKMSLYTIVKHLSYESSDEDMTLDQAYQQLCLEEGCNVKKPKEIIKQVLKEETNASQPGMFGRYKGKLMMKIAGPSSPQTPKIFEEFRKQQIQQDEEKRNQVINTTRKTNIGGI